MSTPLSRRHLLRAGAVSGAAALIPARLSAQGKTLVAATFPGTWNEAHREFLAPAFNKRTGASVTQSILLGNDQLSRLTAAKGGRPPFDVALFDSPQVIDAAKQGLIAEYPAAKWPN
jgi:putative spermidine/putrescine transport system substrate-binding protein